jgi:hypothetical protein
MAAAPKNTRTASLGQPTLPCRRNIGLSNTVERKLGGSCLALFESASIGPLPKIPAPMVYLNCRNFIKFEWDFGKPANRNDATFAGDGLFKTRAVFEYDRDNFITESCFFLSF